MISRVLLYVGAGIVLAGALALWFLWSRLQDAQAEAHLWQQNYQTAAQAAAENAATAANLQVEISRRDELLTQRETALRSLTDDREALRRELDRARQEVPDDVRACFALPVPDSLARVLRTYPRGGGTDGDDPGHATGDAAR